MDLKEEKQILAGFEAFMERQGDSKPKMELTPKVREEIQENNAINTGSLLRIAESLERIERPYLQQLTHIKNLEASNEYLREQLRKKSNQFNGSKGYIKRLENLVHHLRAKLGKPAFDNPRKEASNA